MRGCAIVTRTQPPTGAAMACPTEFLSLRQIAEQYRGAGTLLTWRCRLRRDTGGLRGIARKVGGSVRIERRDVERYIRG
jgi:hypothetical protein